jgi:hypothetical protein
VLWTLKDAKLQIDGSLNNKLTILGMAEDTGNSYYIACGPSLYTRPTASANSGNWTKVPFPTNMVHVSAIAIRSGTIFAGFISANGVGQLYSKLPADANWTIAGDSNISGKQIAKLWVFGGTLVASAVIVNGGTPAFSLLFTTNGSSFSEAGSPAITDEVISVTTNGWAMTKSKVYNGGIGSLGDVTATTTGLTGTLSGMLYSGSRFYAANANGNVFYSDLGLAWTATSSPQKISDKVIIFTGIGQVGSNILIGTIGNGFYQLTDTDNTFATLKRPTEYLNSDLYYSYVRNFFTASDGTTVFFCTAGGGLFNNTYTAGAWGADWIQE